MILMNNHEGVRSNHVWELVRAASLTTCGQDVRRRVGRASPRLPRLPHTCTGGVELSNSEEVPGFLDHLSYKKLSLERTCFQNQGFWPYHMKVFL